MFSLVGGAARFVYTNLDSNVSTFGGKLEKTLKTGRVVLGSWRSN